MIGGKSPNFCKFSQNIKAHIESLKQLHQTVSEFKDKYNKPCLETAYLGAQN